MLGGELVLSKMDDTARVRSAIEMALREPDKIASVSLQREVPPGELEVLARTPRRPDDHTTLALALTAITSLGRSRCARKVAGDAKLASVVAL